MPNFLKEIGRYDKGNMLASLASLPSQFEAALSVFENPLPASYKSFSSIVVSGMGGSGLGGHIAYSLLKESFKTPYVMSREYALPGFVNSSTLVFIISYSGNTEETLESFHEAKKRKAKIIVITSGGKLGALASKTKVPSYIFDPIFNPSNQPRMGLGYLLGAQLAFLSLLKIAPLSEKELRGGISFLRKEINSLSPARSKSPAATLASSLKSSIPVLLGGGFLEGNLHVFANQLNENAKTFATYFSLPEFNHHMLEGLSAPLILPKALEFVTLHSALYSPALKHSIPITEQICRKQNFRVIPHALHGKTKLLQVFETLALSSFTSFYLAVTSKRDPTPIPWVNLFKKLV